jgi:hypothetical protein
MEECAMFHSLSAAMRLIALIILSALGGASVSADETAAVSIADNPLAEIAAEQPAAPQKAARQVGPPITITFQFGDGPRSMKFNLIDNRRVSAETTVGSILSKASASSDFKGTEATIAVFRRRTIIDDDLSVTDLEERLDVAWDKNSNRPTDATNHKLQPGDRVLVKLPPLAAKQIPIVRKSATETVWTPTIPPPTDEAPATRASYIDIPDFVAGLKPAPPESPPARPYQPAAPQAAYAAPIPAAATPAMPATTVFTPATAGAVAIAAPQTPTPRQQFLCRFQIISDPHGNLEQFEPLRSGAQMIGDSESLLGAIRILEKNQLIRRIGEPTVACTAGRPANFRLGEFDHNEQLLAGTEIDITPQTYSSGLPWSLRVRIAHGGPPQEVRIAPEFAASQTLIAKINSSGARRKANDAQVASNGRVYVVLTPELLAANEWLPTTAAAPSAPTEAGLARAAYQAAPAAGGGIQSVQPTQFQVPEQHSFGIADPGQPRVFRNVAAGQPAAQVKFDMVILEDTSGGMEEFIPPNADAPVRLADTPTIRAALRILEKQDLIRPTSAPKLVTRAGEAGTLRIGREIPEPAQDQSSPGLNIEVTGRPLGGGLVVEFKLHQNDSDRKLDMAWEMIVPDGQSVIMKGNWRPGKALRSGASVPSGEPAAGETQNPVYVIVTPELVR